MTMPRKGNFRPQAWSIFIKMFGKVLGAQFANVLYRPFEHMQPETRLASAAFFVPFNRPYQNDDNLGLCREFSRLIKISLARITQKIKSTVLCLLAGQPLIGDHGEGRRTPWPEPAGAIIKEVIEV